MMGHSDSSLTLELGVNKNWKSVYQSAAYAIAAAWSVVEYSVKLTCTNKLAAVFHKMKSV